MNLIEVMHQTCAQMGKLYSGSCTVVTDNPLKLNDPTIRINEDDFKGGTFFLLDQYNKTLTISKTDQLGNFWFAENYTISGVLAPKGVQYSMTGMDRSTLVNAVNSALLSMGEHSSFVDLDVTATSNREFILDNNIVPMKISFLTYQNETYGMTFANTNTWDLSIKDGQAVLTFQNRVVPNETARIRVWYNAMHPRVVNDDDLILPDYHARRLIFESAYQGYFQFLAKEQNSSDRDLLMYQAIMQERLALANKHPVPRLLHKITLPRN